MPSFDKIHGVLRRFTSIVTRCNLASKSSSTSSCSAASPSFCSHIWPSCFGHKNPWDGRIGSRRFYYVDRNNVQHFKKRGPNRWADNPRKLFIVPLVGGGAAATVYFGNIETVPYTRRKHLVVLSRTWEKRLGESQFEEIKKACKGNILPAIHPDSVRVRLIAQDVIGSLKRGLKKENIWTDLGFADPHTEIKQGDNQRETQRLLTGQKDNLLHSSREDELLDDKWIQKSRSKARDEGAKIDISHLESLNWEILIVDQPEVNALCLPGGKIVVFTGLLKVFKTDAEIATVIGHEVGHAVARHVAETITRNVWSTIALLILYQFVMPDVANVMSNLFLKLPFSRRMETEADYIGVLLMASAGYDPRVAPGVYERLGQLVGDSALQNYLSTHPSGKKRAELLANAKVMEEALSIYRDSIAGRGIEGFF